MENTTYCLALDLKNDEESIYEYKQHHQQSWPDILESIVSSDFETIEVYNVENHLYIMMTVNDNFSFEKNALSDEANLKVQEWESLIRKYQQALPCADNGMKWILMERIFQFESPNPR